MTKKLIAAIAAVLIFITAAHSVCAVYQPTGEQTSSERTVYPVNTETDKYKTEQQLRATVKNFDGMKKYLSSSLASVKKQIDLSPYITNKTDTELLKHYIKRYLPESLLINLHYLSCLDLKDDGKCDVTYNYGWWEDDSEKLQELLNTLYWILDGVYENRYLTEVEKALILHDRIASTTTYDYGAWGGSIYGVLVNHSSVCEGYTDAYYYVCTLCDLDCREIVSDELNHMWNLIYLDGVPYHVDVTWDSCYPGQARHENFLVSSEAITATGHKTDYLSYMPDEANSKKYEGYFGLSYANTVFYYANGRFYYVNAQNGTLCSAEHLTDMDENAEVIAENCKTLTFDGEFIIYSTPYEIFAYDIERKSKIKLCSIEQDGDLSVELWDVLYFNPFQKNLTYWINLYEAQMITVDYEPVVYKTKNCGDGVTWFLNPLSGELILSGEGKMTDYDSPSDVPWDAYRSKLTAVRIGEGVQCVGRNAFFNCPNVKTVLIDSAQIAEGSTYGRSVITAADSVAVRSDIENVGTYITNKFTASGTVVIEGKEYTVYGKMIKGDDIKTVKCGDNAEYTVNYTTKTMRVTGSGAIYDYDNGDSMDYRVRRVVESIEICEGITNIGRNAFSWFNRVKYISIPESVAVIGEGALQSCPQLEKIMVAENNNAYCSKGNCLIDTAQKKIIAGCNTSVIPDDGSVIYIGRGAFSGTRADGFLIPGSVKGIFQLAFTGSEIRSLTIGEGVEFIDWLAFEYCPELTDVTLPGSVKSIGMYAFSDCEKLKRVNIANGVLGLSESMFSGCTSLETVVIPASVEGIGSGAFYNCDNLKTVYFGGTREQWEQIDISGSGNEALQNAEIVFNYVPVIFGDCTGDGVIDGKDLIRLRKYLDNYDSETGVSSTETAGGADCTGDGVIDGRDLIRLRKYLDNYDSETGTSTVTLGN